MTIQNRLRVFIASLFVFLSASVQATSFYPQPFPEAVSQAPNIIRGTIGTSYSDWGHGQEGARQIYTFYELQVSEVLKGDAPKSTLTIRELGGEKDGVGLQIPGTSHYSKNEDVVIFLGGKGEDTSFPVQGMMMGKFNIQSDENGAEYLIGPAFSNEQNPPEKNAPKRWSLADLRKLIRKQAENSSPQPALSNQQATQSHTISSQEVPPQNSQTAPQLQPPTQQETQLPNSLILLALVVGIGLFGLLIRIFIVKKM